MLSIHTPLPYLIGCSLFRLDSSIQIEMYVPSLNIKATPLNIDIGLKFACQRKDNYMRYGANYDKCDILNVQSISMFMVENGSIRIIFVVNGDRNVDRDRDEI